ncbi:MAG: hypothetical protein V1816_25145 [Pseudomonadota bacterium]
MTPGEKKMLAVLAVFFFLGLSLPFTAWGGDYLCRRCHLAGELAELAAPDVKSDRFWRAKIETCPGLRWVNREASITETLVYFLRAAIAPDRTDGRKKTALEERLSELDSRQRERNIAFPASAAESARINMELRADLDETVYRPLIAEKRARVYRLTLCSLVALVFFSGFIFFLRFRRRPARLGRGRRLAGHLETTISPPGPSRD